MKEWKVLLKVQKTLDFAAFLYKIKGFLLVEPRGVEPLCYGLKTLENQWFLKSIRDFIRIRILRRGVLRDNRGKMGIDKIVCGLAFGGECMGVNGVHDVVGLPPAAVFVIGCRDTKGGSG